jgi:two-component system sensor histidine kinase TctE
MRGDLVRVVALQLFPPGASDRVLVQVAETLTKRRTLAGEILIVVVVPQVVLICVAGILIWSGIDRGLRPLRHLATEIAARTHRDLRPILDQHVPEEVRRLTDTINDLLQRLGVALSAQQILSPTLRISCARRSPPSSSRPREPCVLLT